MSEKKLRDSLDNENKRYSESKLKNIFQHPIIVISSIAVIGLIIRFGIFPYEIPFTLDSLDYFSYAVLTSQLGEFPDNVALVNNGWPGFISIFFSILNSDNFFDYVHLQRVLTIVISVITIVPVYLLSKQFFPRSFAYIAASLFVLDPRIINNSISGGNYPFYIFLITLAVFMFLSKNNKIIYLSFGILALTSIIRYEGLILLIPFFIMFFFRIRGQKNIIFKYFLVISIVILVLLPIMYLRIEKTGEDGIISHLFAGVLYIDNHVVNSDNTISDELLAQYHHPKDSQSFIISGVTGLGQNLVWVMIPMFIFFLPVSAFIILKNKIYKKLDSNSATIIVVGIFLLLPALYMYARDFQDTRYVYSLIPIIALFSIYSLKIIKIKRPSLLFLMIFLGILLISVSVVSYKNLDMDYDHDRESFKISTFVVKNTEGINYFHPESKFIKSAEVYEKWPDILEFDNNGHIIRDSKLFIANEGRPFDSVMSLQSINNFIEDYQVEGLSHIMFDGKFVRDQTSKEIFNFEEEYPYLIKEYDSKELGLEYHVKIFKIDYEIFNNLKD